MVALCYISPGLAVLTFRSSAMVNQGYSRVFRESLRVSEAYKFRVPETKVSEVLMRIETSWGTGPEIRT